MYLRSLIALAIGCAVALTTTSPTLAATPDQMTEVATMVTDVSIPALMREAHKGGDTEAVFVYQGVRYTVSTLPTTTDGPKQSWLNIWVRKDGSHDAVSLVRMTDAGQDGNINFAQLGAKEKWLDVDGTIADGVEYLPYWQGELDHAITALIAYKHQHQ